MLLLEGYRMLDLSRLAPGPNCSRLLADMGMDVIKVEEQLPRGGFDRDTLTPLNASLEEQERWLAFNPYGRNKRSIAINLKDPKGQELFRRLAKAADVVLEGYRPGVVKRLGIDYATLNKLNPRVVYCSISGYGQDGPYRDTASHDGNFQAVAGLMAMGNDSEGNPNHAGFSAADHGAAVHAAMAILAALLGREKLGRGLYIDVAMTDTLSTFMVTFATNYFRDGISVPRGERWPYHLCVLRCKDGKYLSTQNAETYFWERFCKAIGREDLIPIKDNKHPKYGWMVREVRKTMLTRNRDDWVELLRKADSCISPLNELSEALDRDPHLKHRQFVWDVQHPKLGKVRQLGFPVKFSETPATFRRFAPKLGEHTSELMREAGYSAAEVRRLAKDGVVKVG